MCGVTGYVGKKNGKKSIFDALSKLQYRGHDSAGFACITDNKKIDLVKELGTIELLKRKMHCHTADGHVAIGHVRWACVGEPTLANAHPQTNQSGDIAFVHGGNIANYEDLKRELIKNGHHFSSQTDTQVVPHLLDYYLKLNDNLESALKKLVQTLQGSFALVGLMESHPDVLISIRKSSPLCILTDDDGVRVASDFRAISGISNQGFFQPDETFGIISADEIKLYSFNGKAVPIVIKDVPVSPPIYGCNLFNSLYNDLQDHLIGFLQHILPDRIIRAGDDELIALAKTMLSGSDLNQHEQKHVRSIVCAFDHLEDGTYGLCFTCGHPISEQVLAMHPHMSLCKTCHERSEACA